MELRKLIYRLALAGLIAIAGLVAGVLANDKLIASLAGAGFALATLAASICAARAPATVKPEDASGADFARLIAVGYGWSGLAMLAGYYLTSLYWQHAWQYGLGFVLIAAGILAYARCRETAGWPLGDPAMIAAARWLTGGQALAAFAGVVILALSGKLTAGRSDWAANVVFVAGGLSVSMLSLAALIGEARSSGDGGLSK